MKTIGLTVHRQAAIYENEGNDQQTYLLLFRHARLVLDRLPSHPDARCVENEILLQQLRKDVLRNFSKLEKLKPRINKRYNQYKILLQDRSPANVVSLQSDKWLQETDKTPKAQRNPQISSSHLTQLNESAALIAGENRDLAVQLAHKEIRRRAIARKATRQVGISEEEEHERRIAGLWGNWEEELAQDEQGVISDALSKQLQNIHLKVNRIQGTDVRRRSLEPFVDQERLQFHYPSVPQTSEPFEAKFLSDKARGEVHSSSETRQAQRPPNLPPKQRELPNYQHSLPSRPEKEPFLQEELEKPGCLNLAGPSQQDLKPSTFTFQPSAHLENGAPLRTIFLPPDLRRHFVSLALTNTKANLETCGVLCGTLISNALFISKLVIPDQESTSDTCETVNEGELFDYVDGEDLMVLGWIHTHPTQTCFMSSRDLHTHCGYQVMMPESIAIVCAPSKDE